MISHRATGSIALRRGLILAVALLLALEAFPAVWYVNKNAEPGGDGTSWATAFCTMEEGVAAANAAGGGEVWVAEGEYVLSPNPSGFGPVLVLESDVKLLGGFRGDELDRESRPLQPLPAILDLSGLPQNLFTNTCMQLGDFSVVDGFVFRYGWRGVIAGKVRSARVRNCVFEEMGLGVHIANSTDLLVEDCIFRGNNYGNWDTTDEWTASGILKTQGVNTVVRHCEFTGNLHHAINSARNMLIEGCVFEDNESQYGGAIYVTGTGNRIQNSVFRLNRAMNGGALFFRSNAIDPPVRPTASAFIIINSVFVENSAYSPEGTSEHSFSGFGGAIFTSLMAFPGDSLQEGDDGSYWEGEYEYEAYSGRDGAVHLRCIYGAPCPPDIHYTPLLFASNVFYGNSAQRAGGAMSTDDIWPVVVNSIYWNNGPESLYVASPEPYHGIDIADYPSFSYCILPEFPGGVGSDNLFVDPRFADPENGDFRLMRDSPAIDAGRDVSDPLYGAAVTDFLGRARGFPYASSPGGDGSYYDIGAFEFHPGWHAGDIDGSGSLSLSELLRIIQIFSMGGYHCDPNGEDGYAPGPDQAARDCDPHSSDYNPQDWRIDLTELLRAVQFFNVGGYHWCPGPESEDGYCLGAQ